MATKSRQGFLKRQREREKLEKAERKREDRAMRREEGGGGSQVASADDLAGYGLVEEPTGEPE
ncbi:MAG: hypothetical protein AAF430_08705 [Myxococcota bacterium]